VISLLQGFFYAMDQIGNVEGLGDEITRSVLAGILNILWGAVGRDDDDLNVRIILFDLLQDIDSRKAGHFQVESHKVYLIRLDELEGLLPVHGSVDLIDRFEDHFQ